MLAGTCYMRLGMEQNQMRPRWLRRNGPRRIDIGQNPDVDEPSLQHSTAKCTGKPKSDPKNNDERRLQGFFHCRGAFHGAMNCTPFDLSGQQQAHVNWSRTSVFLA
jgi:hypothetical protein